MDYTLTLSAAQDAALDAEVLAAGQPVDTAHRYAVLLDAITQRLAGRLTQQAQDAKDALAAKFAAAKDTDTKATILAATPPLGPVK